MTQTQSFGYHPGITENVAPGDIPSGTEDRFTDVAVRRDVMATMSDGVRLCADIYLPEGAGNVPAILTRHPYGKNTEFMGMRATGEFWARKGYAFVCQDVRGRFGSEGSFDSPLGRHEITDGYDSIEWIINQDWSNGTVGMWGESYYGFTSYCGAISGHRALEAIAPGDPRRRSPSTTSCTAKRPSRSTPWAPGGWPWTPQITTRSTASTTSNVTGVVGPVAVGKQAAYRWDTTQAFFDHYLMDLDNGFEKRPQVEIFVMGDNTWRSEAQWPLKRAVDTAFYLQDSGGLGSEAGGDTPDSFVYDPAKPVSDTIDAEMWAAIAGLADRSAMEQRDDVLVYTSAALDQDMEITGQVRAEIHAASSAVNTDFTVALVDVFEDGYAHLIQHGIIRTGTIEPATVNAHAIDLWSTSHVVKRGHRLRVEVSSSRFNEFDRNLNSGEPQGQGANPIPATQTIHHSAKHPPHIVLPVVPR